MNNSQDPTLDSCGSCQGVQGLTPESLENLPGLSALAYRVGTHASFKSSMIARLSAQSGPGQLTTRDDSDPGIALLDACATMLDVLTFYQERIANEGYLRTATERRSVLELARQIGYELNPGVAASTYLAFTLETAAGSPGQAEIGTGTRVQSLPEQGQTPQSFETVEAISAQAAWNEMKPPNRELVLPRIGQSRLYLQGVSTNLKPGDTLLVVGQERLKDPGSERWDFRRVESVQTFPDSDPALAYTLVTVTEGLGSFMPYVTPAAVDPRVYALRLRANLFGYNASDWRGMIKDMKLAYTGLTDPAQLIAFPDWPDFTIAGVSDPPTDAATGSGLFGEYFNNLNFQERRLVRTDATINFNWGNGSPAPGIIGADTFTIRWTGWVQPSSTGTYTFYVTSDDGCRLWVNNQLIISNWVLQGAIEKSGTIQLQADKKYDIKLEYFENGGVASVELRWSGPGVGKQIIPASRLYPRDIHSVHLDAVYSQIINGSWVVLSTPEYQEVYQVESDSEDAKAQFNLSAKTTRLVLRGEGLRERFNEKLREVSVFAQSEELPMAPEPITRPLRGSSILLTKRIPALAPGRFLIVSGRRTRMQTEFLSLKLNLTGSNQIVPIVKDEPMLLLKAPAPLENGKFRWSVKTKAGLVGSVDAAEDRFTFLPSDPADETVSEVAKLKSMDTADDPTLLVLESPLTYFYDINTVSVYGNVALSTHGETRKEVLGSGDASQAFQKFTLKNAPLTFVSAVSASGARSTLEVRVDDILWTEVPSLYTAGPRERVYITRRADDGKVTVEFGDGVNGARLPTGTENVRAVYRMGIGSGGMVKAGQLSLLMTRILGVQKAGNPLAPAGAADPEDRDDARQNAPFTVMTLDRVVSLQDFEDFARAYAGIGKSQAAWLWDGENRVVHLTVAASSPAADNSVDFSLDPKSELYKNLRLSLDASRDPIQRLQVDSYHSLLFRLRARLLVLKEYLPDLVTAAVKTALLDAYAFKNRSFGQSVRESEVLAFIQGVAGVEAAFLDSLYYTGQPETINSLLPAQRARWEGSRIAPADLLLIDPLGVVVEAIKR